MVHICGKESSPFPLAEGTRDCLWHLPAYVWHRTACLASRLPQYLKPLPVDHFKVHPSPSRGLTHPNLAPAHAPLQLSVPCSLLFSLCLLSLHFSQLFLYFSPLLFSLLSQIAPIMFSLLFLSALNTSRCLWLFSHIYN